MKLFLLEGPGRLQKALLRLRPQIAQAAQKIYDEWDQGSEGTDLELGEGGICDEIAREINGIVAQNIPDVETDDYGWEGDDHAAVVASLGPEKYVVDIPSSIYETGGGYAWKKVPDVKFSADDVVIVPV
jgi:hypothetical protein